MQIRKRCKQAIPAWSNALAVSQSALKITVSDHMVKPMDQCLKRVISCVRMIILVKLTNIRLYRHWVKPDQTAISARTPSKSPSARYVEKSVCQTFVKNDTWAATQTAVGTWLGCYSVSDDFASRSLMHHFDEVTDFMVLSTAFLSVAARIEYQMTMPEAGTANTRKNILVVVLAREQPRARISRTRVTPFAVRRAIIAPSGKNLPASTNSSIVSTAIRSVYAIAVPLIPWVRVNPHSVIRYAGSSIK